MTNHYTHIVGIEGFGQPMGKGAGVADDDVFGQFHLLFLCPSHENDDRSHDLIWCKDNKNIILSR